MTALRLALLREEATNPLFSDPHPRAEGRARRLSGRQLRGASEAFFVAWEQRRAVGLIRCAAILASPLVARPRIAVLTTAYVQPGYRRRGVLRRLVRAAERWCRTQRLDEIRLRCGVHNSGGNAAWQALGFSPVEVVHRRLLRSP